MQKLSKLLYKIILVIFLCLAGLTFVSIFGFLGKYKLFSVQSGSMESSIVRGSLIIIKSQNNYEIGDVITYKITSESDIKDPKLTITHRIIKKIKKNNKLFYITKGDANNLSDLHPISFKLVLGKVVTTIPFLGYPISYSKTQIGFIIMIIFPSAILIYSEILAIKNQLNKILSKPGDKNSKSIRTKNEKQFN